MALFSERYYANKNGTGAAKATSASKKRKGSFSERYYADKYSKSIGFDTFDNDLKTTNDLLSNIYQNWQDTDSMAANREKVSAMRNRLNDLYSYSKFSGQDTEEIKKVLDAYDSAIKEWDSLTEYYGGFKSGDAYTNYMKEQAEKEALANKSVFDEYRYLLEDEDFMKNANYDAAKKNVSFWDNLTGKSELAEVRNETRDGFLGDVQRTLQAVLPNDSAKYGYLTDEELKVYYAYLANNDKKGAENFLDKMSKELNKRMTDTRTGEMRDLAQSNGVWGTISTVGSLGMNFLGGISSVAGDVKNLITGEEVDANDYSHFLSNMGDAARGGVSEDIRENSKVLSFLYDTGMSVADSALNVVALGGGAVANLATKAYSSKMKEMQDMGASQTEMLLTSALSGGIEALTEKISVGNLLKPKGITTLRSFIGETFKQAGVEASEEAISSVLNQTVDALNGFALNGTSSIKTSYEDYLLRGYTEEEAQKEVAKEGLTDVLLSAIGGAISGGAMGGISNTAEGIGNYNVGKFVSNNNRLGELTDLATEVGPIGEGKNAVDYAQQLQNSPNKATIGYAYKNVAEEANRQASELDRSETKELITRRLVEMGESGETAMDMAEAIISQREGKATASQRKMIQESGIAADAVKELGEGADWTTKSTEGLRKAQGLRDKLKSISTMRDASVVKAEQRASEMNVADTTTDIATGNEIDIEGVRYDENGEAILQTSEGERTLSQVTLTSNNAIAIAYAQDMDRAAADTFVSLYDGKQDFEQYKDSFELVWNYGKDGYGSDSVLSHLGNLTESQALAVYKAGMTSEVAKAQKAVNAIKKQYQGFSAVGNYDDSIIDYNGVDSSKVNFNDLSDNQKQNLVVAQTIAKGLGLNVKLFSSKHGENKANGYYDSKTNTIGIDVYAEQKGGSLHNGITTAMSHELTHWMKDKSPKLYNEMRELVMNGLSKASGVSGDVLAGIEAYRLDSRHKGVEHSDSAAIDELIARACEDMLSNSKVAKNLLENMSEETRASFVDKVKEFLSKIKEAISSIMGRFDSESREAKLLREMDGMADKMAELWDAMIEDSVETNDALNTAEVKAEYDMAASDKQLSERVGVGFDADTESVYPKQFSLKTWTESEYQQNVDEAVEDISKKLKVSKKKARQYIDNINSIAKMIADDRQRLDYESNVDESATSLKENSEYKWTVDMSTLCAKRLLFTGTFDSIQKKLMNTALTSEDIVRIRQMMEERGYTVACGICYVESTRREMGPITAEFIKQYKEAQKNGTAIHRINSEGKSVELKEKGTKRNFFPEEGYTPTLADLNTTDIDIVKRDHPDVYGAYLSFMNARGQAKPKLLETRTEYKGEILKHFKSKSAVKSRNDAGGLRVQSFSDFEVAHLIDMMQIAMDMSRVGLYSQAYTKVPAFADVFGGTGMKINLSLIAKGDGLDADGNLIFDDVEGIDHKEAFRLREKWSENVGTILVGKNDAHIIKAMADPRIDYIIPFHKSSWKESLYSALGLTGYGDYTDTQNEKPLDKNRKIKNFAPSEYWDYTKSGDENAQTYLEMCKADGRIPKFPQFAHYEGYWKLLIDFKMYDNNGVGVPQRAVRPDFDMEAAEKILNEYEGGHRSFPVAEDVVDDFVAEYKGEHPGVQYSDKVEPIAEEDYKNMIKHFGTTGNFNVSGYMLTDGKMLDFSGKHWGDTTSRTRQVDHRDVSEVLPDENNGIDSMVRMISNGNIRLMPENGGINLAVAPTKNQRTVLRRYIEYMSPKEGIVVDIDEVGGDTIKSIRFNKGTSADTVMKAIDNYFKGGNQSELMQFHMQYSDKDSSYLDAVNRGDMETAQKMVDEVAKKAGYNYRGVHRAKTDFTVFDKAKIGTNRGLALGDGFYVSLRISDNMASSYADDAYGKIKMDLYVKLDNPLVLGVPFDENIVDRMQNELSWFGDDASDWYGESSENIRNMLLSSDSSNQMEAIHWIAEDNHIKVSELLKKYGYDGVIKETTHTSQAVVFDENQLKSADTVTYDDNGNIIPLSQRFNSADNDIRFSDKGSDGEELGSYYKTLARKLERENEYLKTRHENYKARIEKARRIEQITKKASRMNDLLKKNSKDYHVPEILKEPLEAVLSAIDFSSKTLLKKGEPTGKDIKLAQAFSNLQDVLTSIDKAQITDNDIEGIYGHFDMPEGFVEYVMDVKNSINSTIGKMDGEPIVLNRLTKAELDMVYDILTVLNKSIRQMDMALSSAKSMRISEISNSTKGYLDSIQKLGNEQPLMQKMKGFLGWENVLPVYAMSRFGEGGDTIMELLQNGWDKLAFNVNRVIKFSEDTYTKKQLKEWEGNTKTFTVSNGNKGKEITLTDSQIMSLYCLSKREQAKGHLFGKGITIGSYETKDKKIKKVTQEDSTLLTEKELKNIISSLSQEQIQVANQLQEFMNTVCAEWGNQVTMVRFGIKSFGEKDYFPIQSDSNAIESSPNEKNNSLFRLLNLSFTKSLTKNANNPIMVNSIFDVFANHSSDMAKYNALALPVLDAYKWYSAKGSTRDKNGKITDVWSLRKSMDNAYGKSAQSYIRRLLEDMNGQSSGGQDIAEGWARKLMSNYKVASVAANLRVAILQPTSYVRARLVLDNKYLVAALSTRPSKVKESIEKAKETCGIALWKSMGFYDTNISKGVTDKIKHNDTVMDEIKDKSMILTEKADEITWGFLYRACMLEQKDKGLTGEALEKATASRLREVIYKTQVVDSTLTRTQLMRSKSGWSQMLTSFMSEPSVSWSILSDVAFKWLVDARGGNHKRAFAKHGKAMKDAAMTYLITATTAAIIGALPDMLRDNDDDETMLEKFTVSALDNALSDVTGLLPIVRDVFNAMKGYESTRMDQEVFSTAVSAYKKLTDGEFTYKDVYYTARAISQASGLPFSNVIRELSTLWNNTVGNIYPNNKLK